MCYVHCTRVHQVNSPTQLLHSPQCEARGGLNTLHVTQNFSFTSWPLTITVLYRAGVPTNPLAVADASEVKKAHTRPESINSDTNRDIQCT